MLSGATQSPNCVAEGRFTRLHVVINTRLVPVRDVLRMNGGNEFTRPHCECRRNLGEPTCLKEVCRGPISGMAVACCAESTTSWLSFYSSTSCNCLLMVGRSVKALKAFSSDDFSPAQTKMESTTYYTKQVDTATIEPVLANGSSAESFSSNGESFRRDSILLPIVDTKSVPLVGNLEEAFHKHLSDKDSCVQDTPVVRVRYFPEDGFQVRVFEHEWRDVAFGRAYVDVRAKEDYDLALLAVSHAIDFFRSFTGPEVKLSYDALIVLADVCMLEGKGVIPMSVVLNYEDLFREALSGVQAMLFATTGCYRPFYGDGIEPLSFAPGLMIYPKDFGFGYESGYAFCGGFAEKDDGVKIPTSNLRAEQRAEREAALRKKAAKKAKAAVRKEDRMRRKKAAQEARQTRDADYDDFEYQGDTVEYESGNTVRNVAKAVLALVGSVALFRTKKKVDVALQEVSDLIKTIKKHVSDFLAAIKKHLPFYGKICGLLVIWKLLNKTPVLWAAIQHMFPKPKEEIELQSGVHAISGVFCGLVMLAPPFRGLFCYDKLKSFINTSTNVPRASAGVSTVLTWAMSAIRKVLEFLPEALRAKLPSCLKESVTEVTSFCHEVEQFAAMRCRVPDVSKEQVDTWNLLMDWGLKLQLSHSGLPKETSLINQKLAMLRNIAAQGAGCFIRSSAIRQEPEFLLLHGPSRMGKTTILPLASILIAQAMAAEGHSGWLPKGTIEAGDIFHTKGESKFWEGYRSQVIYQKDDMFQIRPVPGVTDDSDIAEVFRICSPTMYPLNYATLENKGKFFFTSKMLFATTNMTSFSEYHKVILDPSAAANRVTLPFRLGVNEQFQTDGGTLSHPKFIKAFEKWACTRKSKDECWYKSFPDVWTFTQWDYKNGQETGLVFNTAQFFDHVVKRLSDKETVREPSLTLIDMLNATYQKSEPLQMQSGLQPGVRMEAVLDTTEDEEDSESVFTALEESIKETDNVFRRVLKRCKEGLDHYLGEGWRFGRDGYLKASGLVRRDLFSPGKPLAWLNKRFFDIGSFAVSPVTIALAVGAFKLVCGMLKSALSAFRSVTKRTCYPDLEVQSGYGLTDSDRMKNESIFKKAVRFSLVEAGGREVQMGTVHKLRSRIYLFNKHFIKEIGELHSNGNVKKLLFTFAFNSDWKNGNNAPLRMEPDEFLRLRRHEYRFSDLVLVEMPHTFESRLKNISLSLFPTEQDVARNSEIYDLCIQGVNIHREGDSVRLIQDVKTINRIELGKEPLRTQYETHSRYWSYRNAGTEKGDCGSAILLGRSIGGKATFLGIHFGANKQGVGFGAVITRELIEEGLKTFGVIIDTDSVEEDVRQQMLEYDREVEFQSERVNTLYDRGSFLPLGTMSRSVPTPMKSSIVRSKVYGRFAKHLGLPSKKPAMAGKILPGSGYNNFQRATLNYSTKVLHVRQDKCDKAMEVAFQPLRNLLRGVQLRVLPYDTAVRGSDTMKFKGVTRKTSAGLPYCLKHKDGKRAFFGAEGEYDLTTELSQKLEERVRDVVDSARQGVARGHLYLDFPKDECLPLEKVDDGKVRMISNPSLDYVVACRMYFGHLSSVVNSNPVLSGTTLGINVYDSLDVQNLVSWLCKHHDLDSEQLMQGKMVDDSDIKGFDTSHQPNMQWAFLRQVNNCYASADKSDNLVREVLFDSLVNSIHVTGDGISDHCNLVSWTKGLPSGHFLTSLLNSYYVLACNVYAYGELQGWDKVERFWYDVSMVANGDDCLRVNAPWLRGFETEDIVKVLHDHLGLTVQPADKTDKFRTKSLSECEFLKRSFRFEPGVGWMFPIRPSSFLESLYYVRDLSKELRTLGGGVDQALVELSFHPPGMWDQFGPELVAIRKEFQLPEHVVYDRRACQLRATEYAEKLGWLYV